MAILQCIDSQYSLLLNATDFNLMFVSTSLLFASDMEFDSILRAVLEEENYSPEDELWQRLCMQLDVFSDLLKTNYLNSN